MRSPGAIAPEGVSRDDTAGFADPHVSVITGRRVRSQADVVRLIVGLALVGVAVLVATWLRNTIGGADDDLTEVYERVPARFGHALTGVAVVAAGVVPVLSFVVLVVRRRHRLTLALMSGGVSAGLAMWWLAGLLADSGVVATADSNSARVVELTSPALATSPLVASVVAVVIVATPALSRQWHRVLWGCVGLLAGLGVVSSSERLLDVLVAFAVGMAAGSLVLLVFGTERPDPDAGEVVAMLRTTGRLRRVEQLPATDRLAYAVDMADGSRLKMRVRTVHDRSNTALEALWRSVRLRTWLTDRPHGTVQRRIEHEALAQRAAADSGVRVAAVRGIVSSPNGSVGLLEDQLAGEPVAARDGRLDRALALDIWRQVQCLHAGRIAHRNLDLTAVWVTDDGRASLRDFDGAAIAASDRELALDRAQMLVSTALVLGASAAVDVAVDALGPHAVVSAIPYLQPLALTGPTRRAWRADKGVLDALRTAIADATGVAPAPLARLDRIRPRTAIALLAFTLAVYALLPQFGSFGESVDAARSANWWWLAPMLGGAATTTVCAAWVFVASVAEPIPYLPALRMQIASSFLSRIAPANTGTLAVGVRFLQRSGLEPGPAAAAVGLAAVVGFAVHLSLTATFLLWLGANGVDLTLPQADGVFVVIAVALVAGAVGIGLVPALRQRVLRPVIAQARSASSALADVLTDPLRVISLIGGSAGVTFSFIVTLAASVAAFGGGVSLPQVAAAYLVAAAFGAVAPAPGGVGFVEWALAQALTNYGMPSGPALSAVLTYRLITHWLPMLPGWFMFHQMQRSGEL